MKKSICILLAWISFVLILTSCNSTQIPPVEKTTPSNAPTTSSPARPVYYYTLADFASIEEFYQKLRDISEEDLRRNQKSEDEYMAWYEKTHSKIHRTKAELEHGIFGSFRKKLLECETLLFPYYQGEPLPLKASDFFSQLEFVSTCQRPRIYYAIEADFSVAITLFDPSLAEEANKKGASWLMAKLDPDEVNVYNYVEKTYSIGDRDTLAAVLDDENNITVFFVYDDILVCLTGSPGAIEAALPHLTFREIHMPTGEPVRDTPGRDWSEGGVDGE